LTTTIEVFGTALAILELSEGKTQSKASFGEAFCDIYHQFNRHRICQLEKMTLF
jgi:hypothetical protein